jgi:hypothetical protein
MKNFLSLALILSLLAAAALGCKWNLGSTEQPRTEVNQNTEATPEVVEVPDSSGAEAQFAVAEPLVGDLYKQHDANKGPFREKKRAVVDKYFAKPLADLIWKDKQTPPGEMGAIDFDPLYDAQDVGIKKFAVGKASVNGDKATVPVTFENYGEKKTVTYQMVRQGDAWKIADIKYQHGFTLLSVFKENAKAEPPPPPPAEPSDLNEFEGRYRVGDTTCTVEFKNKGYAVRWAKGSGVEYFSFMGDTTFASSTVESEANKFVFDDENYNTGTFFRADGKTFQVSRAK